MKVTVLKSLDKGIYKAILKTITEKVVEEQNGYLEVTFEVPTEQGLVRGSMNIFPREDEDTKELSYEWPLRQLVDKAGLEGIKNTDELLEKEVELYYSHGYYNKQDKVQITKKQWNLFEPTAPTKKARE